LAITWRLAQQKSTTSKPIRIRPEWWYGGSGRIFRRLCITGYRRGGTGFLLDDLIQFAGLNHLSVISLLKFEASGKSIVHLGAISKLQLLWQGEYKFFLNGKPVRILIDLRTNVLYITPELAERLGLDTYRWEIPDEQLLRASTGEKLVSQSLCTDFLKLDFVGYKTWEMAEVILQNGYDFTVNFGYLQAPNTIPY
jgi:hypothetical protein